MRLVLFQNYGGLPGHTEISLPKGILSVMLKAELKSFDNMWVEI
jgi:hypothetical protein